MPSITLTGWKRKIREYCDSNGVDRTDSQVSRMAVKIHKRMERMNDVHTFEDGLRILGIITDETPMLAIRNIERAAA